MRIKIITLVILLILGVVALVACNPIVIKVTNVTPITWVQSSQVATEKLSEGHEVTGAAIGGTAGWLIVGGPIGLLAGATVGALSAPHTSYSYVTRTDTIHGFDILLSNGESLRTTTPYAVGQVYSTY